MNFPTNILMVSPDYFDVTYKINTHMNQEIGVDRDLAFEQWSLIKESYNKLGFNVITIKGVSGLPDMVFAANLFFTHPEGIIYSKMKYPQRAREVDEVKKEFSVKKSYNAINIFEGMGDLLWDYEGERLFGGHGFRTEKIFYEELPSEIKNYSVEKLELINENFYHLDTCLSVINKDLALFVPSAFSNETVNRLKSCFKTLVEVDEFEAINFLACNAHSPDGKNILVESRAQKLIHELTSLDFKLVKINTSEFLKSGGSIFCLKNQTFFNPYGPL